jgi:hypothetical protein
MLQFRYEATANDSGSSEKHRLDGCLANAQKKPVKILSSALNLPSFSSPATRLPPIRIWDEQKRLITASHLMTETFGPSLGKPLPGERPRENAET